MPIRICDIGGNNCPNPPVWLRVVDHACIPVRGACQNCYELVKADYEDPFGQLGCVYCDEYVPEPQWYLISELSLD